MNQTDQKIPEAYDQYSQYAQNYWPENLLLDPIGSSHTNNINGISNINGIGNINNNSCHIPKQKQFINKINMNHNQIEHFTSLPNNTNPQSKEIKCPPNTPNICGPGFPFQCVIGKYPNRCAKNRETFNDDPTCFRYCNILQSGPANPPKAPNPINPKNTTPPLIPKNTRSVSGTILAVKQTQCPSNFKTICKPNVPYQCIEGPLINECSSSANQWNNTKDCGSYCNIYGSKLGTIPPKKQRILKITNNCAATRWIGLYGISVIADGGFELGAYTTKTITVPSNWAGRIWARSECIFGPNSTLVCKTGDCGGKIGCTTMPKSSVSYVEFTLSPTSGTPDNYKVYLTDIPIYVSPIQGTYEKVNSATLGKFNCGPIHSNIGVTENLNKSNSEVYECIDADYEIIFCQ